MPISVTPLVTTYSFNANRRNATDQVDAAALDAVFLLITDKINEIITALDVTTRDDDTLADAVIEARHLADDAVEEISAMINAQVTPP